MHVEGWNAIVFHAEGEIHAVDLDSIDLWPHWCLCFLLWNSFHYQIWSLLALLFLKWIFSTNWWKNLYLGRLLLQCVSLEQQDMYKELHTLLPNFYLSSPEWPEEIPANKREWWLTRSYSICRKICHVLLSWWLHSPSAVETTANCTANWNSSFDDPKSLSDLCKHIFHTWMSWLLIVVYDICKATNFCLHTSSDLERIAQRRQQLFTSLTLSGKTWTWANSLGALSLIFEKHSKP